MNKRRYTFTVLRYVHDRITGEFVNVGVLVFFPATSEHRGELRALTRRTIGRMRNMFPDLARSEFLLAMNSIERGARKLSVEAEGDPLGLSREYDVSTFANRILSKDDSALQWSPVGGGIANDVSGATARLFHRHVTKYDEKNLVRRSDEEVWKPVRQLLEQRNIPVDLEKKTISGDGDLVHFQHAWKNGVWHAYEPLSMDLADEDGIVKKAHRWLGQLTSVNLEPAEPFHAHFIVGAPSDARLIPAYRRAIRILKKSPGTVDVFEEDQIEQLVDLIEDEVRAHRQIIEM